MSKIFKVIVLINTDTVYGRQLILGISDYSKDHKGWTFFRANETSLYADPQNLNLDCHISLLQKWGADGLIAVLPAQIAKKISSQIPIVCIPIRNEAYDDVPRIISDDMAIGEMAADKLLQLGYRNFAYCGYDAIWLRERAKAFHQKLSAHGYTALFHWENYERAYRKWEGEYSRLQTLSRWLKTLPKPVGVMAGFDELGHEVIKAGALAGLSIPEELGVIGVDNDEFFCEMCQPPLTSVVLNTRRAGYDAASLLDRLMKGRSVTKSTVVVKPLYVEERPSTDILAGGDNDVAEAMRYIRMNITREVSVSDVVNAVSVSRRLLYRKFTAVFGCAIGYKIRQMRIEQIQKMLVTTDLSISQIAERLGFSDSTHISRYFQQSLRIRPSAYRQMYCRVRSPRFPER